MKNKLIVLFVGSLTFIFSCTKSTGPQGPQGPAGLDGNANVIGSDAFTVSQWTASGNTWTATFTDPDITQAVVNTGLVEVYKQYQDSWTNLPDINGINSTVFNFYVGGFQLLNSDADGLAAANPGTQVFRVVIIPSSLRLAHPNTNWANYKEASAIVNAAAVANTTANTANQ